MHEPTALVLVDLQTAAFGGAGIPPMHEADRLLQNALRLLHDARRSGIPVVHIQHCGEPGKAFAEGAPGWPILPAVSPLSEEPLVLKRARNAFEGTDLDEVLRRLGARRIIVAGLQSELCVAATCRGALKLGYEVRLARDGHSTWPDLTRTANEIIAGENEALAAEGAVLLTTANLVEWLRGLRSSDEGSRATE